MNEKEVKEFIGRENWDDFEEWISGQTIGLNEYGETDFYKWDVEIFKERLTDDHNL